MLEPGDVQEERLLEIVTERHEVFGMTARTGEEAPVVEAVINRRQALSRNVEITGDVARGVFAHCDDAVLALRQPPGHDAAIEHSLPIVLSRHAEESQIMNGGDERARPRPKHAPIAWKRML